MKDELQCEGVGVATIVAELHTVLVAMVDVESTDPPSVSVAVGKILILEGTWVMNKDVRMDVAASIVVNSLIVVVKGTFVIDIV